MNPCETELTDVRLIATSEEFLKQSKEVKARQDAKKAAKAASAAKKAAEAAKKAPRSVVPRKRGPKKAPITKNTTTTP